MGFEGVFFGRADYQDIGRRYNARAMEMIWKASANLGQQAWLFTGILPNGYGPPIDFNDIRVTQCLFMILSVIICCYRMTFICTITTFQNMFNHLSMLLTTMFVFYYICISHIFICFLGERFNYKSYNHDIW